MSKPKTGTLVHLEVLDNGMKIDIQGSPKDVVVTILTAMDNDERIKEMFLDAAKQYMLHSMLDGIEGKGEPSQAPSFEEFMQGLKERMEREGSLEGEKPHFDFSNVVDLLTDEEKAQL